jgi:excisionase family DNA binding protein
MNVQASLAPADPPRRRLLVAAEVAELLGCSWRHILRMADRGDMPWGVKVGHLRRWDVAEIEKWIEGSCKPVRNGGR